MYSIFRRNRVKKPYRAKKTNNKNKKTKTKGNLRRIDLHLNKKKSLVKVKSILKGFGNSIQFLGSAHDQREV